MSALKRTSSAMEGPSTSDEDVPIATPAMSKRSKTGPTLSGDFSAVDLAAYSPQELIAHVLELQQTLDDTQTKLKSEKSKVKNLQKAKSDTTLTPTSGNTVAQEWPAEKIADRADKLADQAAKAIKKQMKWQPSCKRRTTKWSHTGVAPNPQVFFKMLDLPADGKAWKQKKVPLLNLRMLSATLKPQFAMEACAQLVSISM